MLYALTSVRMFIPPFSVPSFVHFLPLSVSLSLSLSLSLVLPLLQTFSLWASEAGTFDVK